MGMVGRYIDALAIHGYWTALDRVITAQSWCFNRLYDEQGAACIRGHVHGIYTSDDHEARRVLNVGVTWETADELNRLAFPNGHAHDTYDRVSKTVPTRFNHLCARFGVSRTVRLIKARAGKHTRPNIELSCTLESAVRE